MNKRKIILLASALLMVAILGIGGTLAYFTAEDGADNVFTMGYVDIELEEDFEQESELTPGMDVGKEVWINNTGSTKAYARVHIAIRSDMDDGDPSFEAVNNFLHFNFDWSSVEAGKWTWFNTLTPANVPNAKYPGYPGTGNDEWNFYTTEIDGLKYNVYVVTYSTAIDAKTKTDPAITKVYLDPSVNAIPEYQKDAEGNYVKDANGDLICIGVNYVDTHGNKIWFDIDEFTNNGKAEVHVKVWAEATQVEPFTSKDANGNVVYMPFEALNEVFGVPGSYNPFAAN